MLLALLLRIDMAEQSAGCAYLLSCLRRRLDFSCAVSPPGRFAVQINLFHDNGRKVATDGEKPAFFRAASKHECVASSMQIA